MSPTRVMEGVTIGIVRAPGGVPIGVSGPERPTELDITIAFNSEVAQ